jgi:SAM-dependent methyltransferase
MIFQTLLRILRQPNKRGQLGVMQDVNSLIRLHFLYAAMNSGVLQALKKPATRVELAERLEVARPDLLDSLLDLGLALGELARRGEKYAIRGERARALAHKANDPLAAFVEECVTYHASAYRHLAERLSGAPLGRYLEETGTLIARSSRVLEPMLAGFVQRVANTNGPAHILEVGCGSGVYLRHAARANPQATGIGVEIEPEVARQAETNLLRWGISERFKIVEGDIRSASPQMRGPFHLVTLYNNIYYFEPEERPALFHTLRSSLVPVTGRLAIVTPVRGSGGALTADFDLILRSTEGCTPLPSVEELTGQLREGGFDKVEWVRLVPLEPYFGVVAWSESVGRRLLSPLSI